MWFGAPFEATQSVHELDEGNSGYRNGRTESSAERANDVQPNPRREDTVEASMDMRV